MSVNPSPKLSGLAVSELRGEAGDPRSYDQYLRAVEDERDPAAQRRVYEKMKEKYWDEPRGTKPRGLNLNKIKAQATQL